MDSECGEWSLKGMGDSLYEHNLDVIKIGNIRENPELLESAK